MRTRRDRARVEADPGGISPVDVELAAERQAGRSHAERGNEGVGFFGPLGEEVVSIKRGL